MHSPYSLHMLCRPIPKLFRKEVKFFIVTETKPIDGTLKGYFSSPIIFGTVVRLEVTMSLCAKYLVTLPRLAVLSSRCLDGVGRYLGLQGECCYGMLLLVLNLVCCIWVGSNVFS